MVASDPAPAEPDPQEDQDTTNADSASHTVGAPQDHRWGKLCLAAGSGLMIITIVIAFANPVQSAFLYVANRSLMALGGALFAGGVLGSLQIRLQFASGALTAGGGLGVFVILYFLNPPALTALSGAPDSRRRELEEVQHVIGSAAQSLGISTEATFLAAVKEQGYSNYLQFAVTATDRDIQVLKSQYVRLAVTVSALLNGFEEFGHFLFSRSDIPDERAKEIRDNWSYRLEQLDGLVAYIDSVITTANLLPHDEIAISLLSSRLTYLAGLSARGTSISANGSRVRGEVPSSVNQLASATSVQEVYVAAIPIVDNICTDLSGDLDEASILLGIIRRSRIREDLVQGEFMQLTSELFELKERRDVLMEKTLSSFEDDELGSNEWLHVAVQLDALIESRENRVRTFDQAREADVGAIAAASTLASRLQVALKSIDREHRHLAQSKGDVSPMALREVHRSLALLNESIAQLREGKAANR